MTPNTAWLIALLLTGPIVVLALVLLAIHETESNPRNRRVRNRLPPPQPAAVGPRHFADT